MVSLELLCPVSLVSIRRDLEILILTDDFLPNSRSAKESSPLGSDSIKSPFALCLFIDNRSFSSFSVRIFCFSNSELVDSSSSWAACRDSSSSP
jgi:hypothetical protein